VVASILKNLDIKNFTDSPAGGRGSGSRASFRKESGEATETRTQGGRIITVILNLDEVQSAMLVHPLCNISLALPQTTIDLSLENINVLVVHYMKFRMLP